MSKPLECPFCHALKSYYENDCRYGYIVCYNCGAQGPCVIAERGAYSKAVRMWKLALKRERRQA